MYTLLIDGSKIYCQTCPLETEIFSSTFSSEDSCSIVAFQPSMDLNVCYLDMGDEVTFSVTSESFCLSLKAFEEKVVSTSVEVYRPDLLQLEKSSGYEVTHGICVKNEVRKFHWNPTDEDQIACYGWDKYGCLMELHYEGHFQPVISLYDGDSYVRNVEANLILWEMKGRTDYGYASFMKEAIN